MNTRRLNTLTFNFEIYRLLNVLLQSNFTLRPNNDYGAKDYPATNIDWLDRIFVNPPSLNQLLTLIRDNFNETEFYHSCCPKKLSTYFRNGIQLLDVERIESEARELIQDQSHRSNLEQGIQGARRFLQEIHAERNQISLHTDKIKAQSEVGFSKYGGEYMAYIILHMPDNTAKHEIIRLVRNCGIPTLLTIRLSLDNIADAFLEIYIKTLIQKWASIFIFKDCTKTNPPNPADLTYNAASPIESHYIYRHEHPQNFRANRNPFYCDRCKKTLVWNNQF
ncbi:hypothetical protein [Legionella sp. 28fT52]|uniref:hypothetical protein n=1 Tax=Legionella sp. 28fT52 TaxID=3410134 RepID=UPI003AF49268